jgi:hypothetical protein
MKMLHQMSDGMVWVRGDAGHYGELLNLFEADYGKKLPSLPEGITERIYEPGVRHALNRGNDTVDGGPIVWSEGDAVIAKLTDLLAKQKKREDDKKAEQQAITDRQMAEGQKLQAELEAKRKGAT